MENNVNEEVKVERTEAEERKFRQERMLMEYRELVVKLANLEYFVRTNEFDNLENEDKELLFKQHRSMCEYADTLVTRILREMK